MTRESVIVVGQIGYSPLPMDFAFTPEEEAFAAKVRRFLAENPPESFAVDGMDAGYGSGSHSRSSPRAVPPTPAPRRGCAWCGVPRRRMRDSGG